MADPQQQQQPRGLFTSTLVLQPVGSRGDIRLDSYSSEEQSRNGPRVSVPSQSQPLSTPAPQFTPAHSSAVSSYTLRTQTTAASFRDSEAPATESQAAASQLDEFLEDDEESREIARKLKESQRRQQEILKRLAEKSSSRRESAAGVEKSPNADPYARTAIDSLSASVQQTENTSRLFTSPLPNANTSFNTFIGSPHAAASLAATPSLNGSAYWPRAPAQPSPPPPAPVSVRNVTLPEPSSFMMQHIISQSQQKDSLIADLRASVGDHIGTANDESVNLKAQMDIVERQQRLREDDLTDRIQDLSMKLSTAMAAENNLRSDVKTLQLEKMELVRAHAIKVGELEARIAGLQSETERRELGQRKVELELATAKKEIDQLQDAAKIAEAEHAQAIQELEAKVAQLTRERTATTDQVRTLSEGDATAQREIKSLKDNIEMKELELNLLQKSKETQAQLLDSVKAQVSGLQEQIAELKTVAAQVPQLKRELEQSKKLELEKEGLQTQLAAAQAAHETEVSEKNQLQAEVAAIQQQRQEFHRQILLAEQRFQELTGPDSELEQTKQQVGYLSSQVEKFKTHVRDLQMDLDQGKERRLLLESKLQSAQNEITADLAVIQRMIELAVSGDYRSLTEGKEGSAPAPTTQSAAVRSAVSSLRLTATSALKELSTLRSVKASTDQQVEKLLTDVATSRNELMESKRANIELQALISGQQQDIKALQNAISDAQQQLSQLRAKAATMESELAERNKMIRGCVHELADIATIARSGQASTIAEIPEDNNAFAMLRTRLVDALEVVKQQLRLRAAEFSHLQSELATSQDRTQQLQQLFRQAQAAEQQKFEELSESHNAEMDRLRHEMEQQKTELESNLAHTTAEATAQLEALAGERDATLAALEQLKSTLEESHAAALQLQNELKKSGSQVSAYRAACNLLFRGYSTLETRCNELSSQKLYLAARNRKLEKVQADVQSLMQAMTGDSSSPASPGPSASLQAALPRKPYGRVFKIGAIAVLAFNRLLRFRRERPVYGAVSKVRGETVALGSPNRLPDDLPELDCGTESRCLDSFNRLLFHFRSVGRQFVPQLPRMASVRSPGKAPLLSVLAPPSLRRPSQLDRDRELNWDGDNENNYSVQVAVIRKVALALSTRIRDLERDNKSLQQRAQDLNTKLTNAIGLNDSLASAHASSSDLGNRLQARVEELQKQLTRTVPEEKYEQLRSQHQQLLEQVTTIESEKRRTQDSLEAVKRQLQMAEASLSSKARAIAALQTAGTERNEELQTVSGYLRHKSEEMAAIEKERRQLQSQYAETHKNLELCLASNLELTARLRSLDSELTSNKELVRQLQTALSQLGSLRVDQSSLPNITLTAQPSDSSVPSAAYRASSTPPRPSSPLFSTLRPSSPVGSLAGQAQGTAPRQLSFNVASPSNSRATASFMHPTPAAPKLASVEPVNRSMPAPQLQNPSTAPGTVDASSVSNMLGGVHISHSKGKLQVAIDRSRWGIAKADGFEQESAVDVVQSVPVGRIEVYSPRRGGAASPSSVNNLQSGFFSQPPAASIPDNRRGRPHDVKRSLNQELTDAMIRSFDSSQ